MKELTIIFNSVAIIFIGIMLFFNYSNDEIDEKINKMATFKEFNTRRIGTAEIHNETDEVIEQLALRTLFADVKTEGCELDIVERDNYSEWVLNDEGSQIGKPQTQFILTCPGKETKITR